MNPKVSIIIASYKNHQILDLCLTSLLKNIKEIDFEIIVVDGETGEKTKDLMREKYPQIFFISNEKNIGFSKLVNQGIKVSKGNIFFIINADIIIKSNVVKEIANFIEKNPQVGILSPKMINFDESIQSSCFRFYTFLTIIYRRTFLKRFNFAKKHLSYFLMEDVKKDFGLIEADWVMGSAMAISRNNLEKIGEMDEGFFMYFEDVDWCFRCWEKGLKVIYCADLSVYHYHGAQSSGKNIFQAILFNKYSRIHIKSAIRFFLKHFGKSNPHKNYNKNRKK